MKRTLQFVVALLLIAGSLAGCSSIKSTPTQQQQPTSGSIATPPPTQAPPEPVTITVWHGWVGEHLAIAEQVFRNYEAAHLDVKVQLVSVPDMNNRLVTEIPNGAQVDVVAFGMDWIGRLAEAGVIAPLDDYGIGADFLRATYIGSAADAMIYKGKAWGLPEAVECLTWFYNKALIGEGDLPGDTDQLLVKAEQWNAEHPGKYFFVYSAHNDVYFSAPWWNAAGARMVGEDGSVGLDSPEGLAAAQFISQLPAIMPPQSDYVTARQLFETGNAAIIQNGPWYLSELEAAGIDYGLAMIPPLAASGQPGKPFLSGKALMLTPNSGHVDIAVDLMKYFTSAESQIAITKATRTIPANRAAVESAEIQAMPDVAHFARQAAQAVPLPTTPYMSALWEPVAKALEAMWTGAAGPQQAIRDAQVEALGIIETMK